jgi:hypothetical protein
LMTEFWIILCRNSCERPSGIPSDSSTVYSSDIGDCELSIGLPNGKEVFAYRHTSAATSAGIGDCLDGLRKVYLDCIDQQKEQGWVNGPDYEFYKMGIRASNDPEALHAKDFYGIKNHLTELIP